MRNDTCVYWKSVNDGSKKSLTTKEPQESEIWKAYLGTPGGTRAGREGICGGALKGSRLLLKALMGGPGRDGMGGAPKAGEGLRGVPKEGEGFMGGPGVVPRTAGGRFGGGAVEGAGLRWGVGLQGQHDLNGFKWTLPTRASAPQKRLVVCPHLLSGIQELFTGGGTGMETVLALMSPIMCSASLSAWYMRNISSLRWAWSADSSIRLFWSPDE